jgi:hypothetical protein
MENTPVNTPAQQPSGTPASNKKVWILVIVVLVLAFGCVAARRATTFVTENAIERAIERSAGDDANIDFKLNGNTTITTDKGTVTIGAGSLPDNWPSDVDVPKNISVTFAGSANPQNGDEKGSYVSYMTDDSLQQVLDYYKDELNDNGWTVEQTATMGTSMALSATKDGRTFGMWAVNAGEKTNVSVGISEEN